MPSSDPTRAALLVRLEDASRKLTGFQIGYGPVFSAPDLDEMHRAVRDAIAALAAHEDAGTVPAELRIVEMAGEVCHALGIHAPGEDAVVNWDLMLQAIRERRQPEDAGATAPLSDEQIARLITRLFEGTNEDGDIGCSVDDPECCIGCLRWHAAKALRELQQRRAQEPGATPEPCANCEAVAQQLLSTHYYHMAKQGPAVLAQAVEFLAADERMLRRAQGATPTVAQVEALARYVVGGPECSNGAMLYRDDVLRLCRGEAPQKETPR